MIKSQDWTPELVDIRLREMGDVCRRLSWAGIGPSRRTGWWPDVVRAVSEAYGYSPASAPPVRPTAEEIARFEAAAQWVQVLNTTDRAIVWGTALGMSLRSLERLLCQMPGCRSICYQAVRKRYRRLLAELARHWTAAGRPVDLATREKMRMMQKTSSQSSQKAA